MATNLFSRAAAYRKKHPSVSQAEAVQILSRQDKKKPAKKAAAKKKVVRKKAHKKAAVGKVKKRAVKISLKKTSKGVSLGISGISMNRLGNELQHRHALQSSLAKHQAELKEKGLTAGEKAHIRREISHYRTQIAASKKHASALKRSI
jgi:hypothetical protein